MISRIAIKNYRSLRDIELRPGPLTVLIGPNGAGKSNIIDALRFLNSILWRGSGQLMDEVGRRGGWNELLWGGQTNSQMRLEIGWEDGDGVRVDYLGAFRQDLMFERESLTVNGERAAIHRAYGEIRSQHGNLQLPDYAFYDFSPSATRGAKPVRREYRLASDGSNLATVVHTLFSDSDPNLDEAVEMLQVCVPTVEKLVSPIFGEGQTYIALREKGVPTPIGSWGLSDGTLLALSIAIALITPQMPDLICIESPEDGIHPQMLETIADMLEVASKHTQVIVTTHSPHLLYWLPPECFVVVKKEAGETNLYPLKDDAELQKIARELGAGEAFYSGFLEDVP